MLSHHSHHDFSAPEPLIEAIEIHHMAHQFRQEVQFREAFDAYCQWYERTATQHQQELAVMKGDINLWGWFFWNR